MHNSYSSSAHFLFLPLHPPHPLIFLAVFPYLLPSFPPRTCSGFLNGMQEVFEPGALNCYILSRLILWTLSVARNPTLTHFSFRIPGFSTQRSDCSHYRSGILSPDDPNASGGVIIFIRKSLFFSELFTTSLSSLTPTLIMQGSTSH